MVTKGLNKITQNETQDLQLVDNFCKSWVNKITQHETQDLQLVDNFCKSWVVRNFFFKMYGVKERSLDGR